MLQGFVAVVAVYTVPVDASLVSRMCSECSEFEKGEVLLRPVHLLRVVLLRDLESNFPGDSLYSHMDMIVPTS